MRRIVLDTNVLLVSVSSRSPLHWIFKRLLDGEYILCVTTDILAEYAEIIGQQMGPLAGESVLGVIENLPNVSLVTAYFKFRLLGDEDDDKFADCAVAGNADCIVTHDRDFKRLVTIEFPKIEVMDTHQFKRLLDA